MEENIENKKERVRAQLDLVLKAIEQENSAFLNIGSLAVALIIILSLNKDLVSFSPTESKVLLTIFLVLIIITLGVHLYFLNEGKKRSVQIIEKITEKKISDGLKISLFDNIIAYIPKVVAGIFFICISYVVYVLWR